MRKHKSGGQRVSYGEPADREAEQLSQQQAIAPGTIGDPNDSMDDFPTLRDAGEPLAVAASGKPGRGREHKAGDNVTRLKRSKPEQQKQSEPDEDGNELPPEAEDAIALVFAERHANELRYVNAWGRWIGFEGARWIEDNTLHTFDRARVICREIAATPDGEHSPRAVASAKTVVAVERLARADRRLAATAEQWDNNSWKLNEKTGDNDGNL